MNNNGINNTGVTTRHLISGAAVSILAAGTVNLLKLKKGEASKADATQDMIKRTAQGTIATASVIAATNYKFQQKSNVKAITALGVGALGVYAVEMLDRKFNESKEEKLVLENNEGVSDE